MNNKNSISQARLIMEFFKKNPNRDISHPEIVDWATDKYKKRTGKIFRDPDRQIRQLHQSGYLIKIRTGIYRYDPRFVDQRQLDSFTPAQKKTIFERDKYKCVQCGMGTREGAVLHVDHVIPRDQGGKSTIDNGQTLCSRCNFLKKNLKQTESGKKMFIRMYKLAKKEGHQEVLAFVTEVLEVYEKHNVNGHIEWKK
ncbi:HNH endonuclease [Candidatus Daviesbacteria bacterium]|nr:HNH endonuclease [Candidatus Daviesbacteria bacterium]